MTLELDAVEARVVGSLIEKELATPEYYPLTMNALKAACNQSSNRSPVVDYDEDTIQVAIDSLRAKGAVRLLHSPSGRASKFRQVLDELLGVDVPERAVLAVMLLRGPQTPGELRSRTERMHAFDSGDALDHALGWLAERDLAVRLERQPGQKEARWATTLAGATATSATPTPDALDGTTRRIDGANRHRDGIEARVAELEERVAKLEALLEELA